MLCFEYIVLRHVFCPWGKTVPMHVGQDGPYVHGAGIIDRVAPGRGPSCLRDGARRLFWVLLLIFKCNSARLFIY